MDDFQQRDEVLRRLKRLHAGGMWTWLFDALERARVRGDQQRQLMAHLLMRGGEGMEGDLERGLDSLNRGRALAEALGEHWWVVLFDHWRLQLLRKKGDYPLARELIMHLVTEVKKPRYEGLPLRVCIQEDMIRLCMDTDPAGYAPRIEQGFRTMEPLVVPGTYCYSCLWGMRVDFAKDLGRWDQVEQCLQVLLRLDADHPLTLAVHHTNRCRLAFERGDRETIAIWAHSGERLARRSARHDCLAECLAWQAFVALDTDATRADSLARAAMDASERVNGVRHGDFYDVICIYYEAAGTPARALDARFSQLKELTTKGRLGQELHCRAEICRLLLALGRSPGNQIAAARKVARGLIDPEPTLARFDRLAHEGQAGPSSPPPA